MTSRRNGSARAFTMTWIAAFAAIAALEPVADAWAQEAKGGASGGATVETVLRKTAEHYKKAKSIAVDLDRAEDGPGEDAANHERGIRAAEQARRALERRVAGGGSRE